MGGGEGNGVLQGLSGVRFGVRKASRLLVCVSGVRKAARDDCVQRAGGATNVANTAGFSMESQSGRGNQRKFGTHVGHS